MGGTYFVARLAVAFIVPLTLASLGPAQSHPELGTDMANAKRNNPQVYRADDVRLQTAVRHYSEKERIQLQAFRRGRKFHVQRRK